MGFGKALKRLGKAAKKGLRIAGELGIVPGGNVGAVIASKLKTRGDKRRVLAEAQAMKPDSLKLKGSFAPPRAPAWRKVQKPEAAKAIQVRGEGAALLASSVGARREAKRKASLERLATIKSTEAKIAKLTPGQKADLAEEFTRQGGGSPSEFRAFLAERL